ncbi:MAG: hypothetical protein ACKPKO_50710, partial [Candidatus Fonsibacter sp.]
QFVPDRMRYVVGATYDTAIPMSQMVYAQLAELAGAVNSLFRRYLRRGIETSPLECNLSDVDK